MLLRLPVYTCMQTIGIGRRKEEDGLEEELELGSTLYLWVNTFLGERAAVLVKGEPVRSKAVLRVIHTRRRPEHCYPKDNRSMLVWLG